MRPKAAPGCPAARLAWMRTAQVSFGALKRALSKSPVRARSTRLCTWCWRRTRATVVAILTQPDEEGQLHPVAYKSHKLAAADRNYPDGCLSDFKLQTDRQAITWPTTNQRLNKIDVPWLYDITDFLFDVT